MDTFKGVSEVARLRQQIEQEYEAAHRGLFGLSQGTVRHDFIQAKMERVEAHHQELVCLVGEKEAAALLCQINDESFERVRVEEGGVARYSRECEYSALYSTAMQRFL